MTDSHATCVRNRTRRRWHTGALILGGAVAVPSLLVVVARTDLGGGFRRYEAWQRRSNSEQRIAAALQRYRKNENHSRRAGAFEQLSLEIDSGRLDGLIVPTDQLLDHLGPPDMRVGDRHWIYL
jgi:hypothetical protein